MDVSSNQIFGMCTAIRENSVYYKKVRFAILFANANCKCQLCVSLQRNCQWLSHHRLSYVCVNSSLCSPNTILVTIEPQYCVDLQLIFLCLNQKNAQICC